MGRSARRLVETRYTWDRVAAMTESAYLEYLEEFPSKCVLSQNNKIKSK
jgi:hypothetical protein